MTLSINDLRDACALLALRELSGRTDADVLAAVRELGYVDHCGLNDLQIELAAEDLGIALDGAIPGYAFDPSGENKPQALFEIYPRIATGTWLVVVTCRGENNAHALVVRDGQIADPTMMNSRAAFLHTLALPVSKVFELLPPGDPRGG